MTKTRDRREESKAYYQKNKGIRQAAGKLYREQNRERIREKQREYNRTHKPQTTGLRIDGKEVQEEFICIACFKQKGIRLDTKPFAITINGRKN